MSMTPASLIVTTVNRSPAAGSSPAVPPETLPPGYVVAELKSIGLAESEIRNRNIFISFEAIYISCHCWYKYSMIFV